MREQRRYSPLLELTVVRTKEFMRETEAVFWVFGFPILLALALGFAFRAKPPERVPVAVVGIDSTRAVAALRKSPVLAPRSMDAREAMQALRQGKVSLVVESGPVPLYRFDPTRPEARTARVEADDALQRAAGRQDVMRANEAHVREQGSRYIDFLMPGLIGMNLMSTGMWGMGFTIVNARMKKILKRLVATPMRKSDFLFAQFLSRLVFLVVEVTFLVAFGWMAFGVARPRLADPSCVAGAHRWIFVRGTRSPHSFPGHHPRRGKRHHEPGDDAYVALLRCLLFLRTFS